jgi:hypothetical protein
MPADKIIKWKAIPELRQCKVPNQLLIGQEVCLFRAELLLLMTSSTVQVVYSTLVV